MKYSMPKRIIYSVLVLALIAGATFTALLGVGAKKAGSAEAIKLGLDLAGGVSITYEADESNPSAQDLEDTKYKLEKRIEGKSTESQVYQSGINRITVEIPGVTDANAILEELGTPGSLEFVDTQGYQALAAGSDYTPILTGTEVKSAQAYTDTQSTNSKSAYGVQLEFNEEGAQKFADATAASVGSQIYIIYDGKIVSAPTVQQKIDGGSCSITGLESWDEANNLATYIRIGSIPLTLHEVSSNIVGAQLGQNAIRTSLMAALIGFILLSIFMIAIYRVPGAVSVIALWLYTMIVVVLLSAYELTLTLPGIAGIILGIGMAVDANVIIYSRIKEEIGSGRSVENAIQAGYHKAMSSIIDGNVTTIIAGVVLNIFGTGSIKGFAQTLILGNVVSMFTSFVITKTVMKLLFNFGVKDPKFYGKTVHSKIYDVIGFRKKAFIIAAVAILSGFVGMGVFAGAGKGAFNLSLEFAGGSSTTFTFAENYSQEQIENDIIPVIKTAGGINEVQQQKVQNSTQVTFKTVDLSLEQREKIEEAVKAKFPIQDGTVVETNNISGSVSQTMRKDAAIATIVAVICMLLYIWLRFRDVKFATAAVAALVHDILCVIAFYAISRTTVGTTFIACILTILGYSINATIIIFDRVREVMKESTGNHLDVHKMLNKCVTYTLQRSINTNITTFIMLASLCILGVASVREFAMPLIVGVICGTYSSIFITASLWYVFGGRKLTTVKKEKKVTKKAKADSNGAVV